MRTRGNSAPPAASVTEYVARMLVKAAKLHREYTVTKPGSSVEFELRLGRAMSKVNAAVEPSEIKANDGIDQQQQQQQLQKGERLRLPIATDAILRHHSHRFVTSAPPWYRDVATEFCEKRGLRSLGNERKLIATLPGQERRAEYAPTTDAADRWDLVGLTEKSVVESATWMRPFAGSDIKIATSREVALLGEAPATDNTLDLTQVDPAAADAVPVWLRDRVRRSYLVDDVGNLDISVVDYATVQTPFQVTRVLESTKDAIFPSQRKESIELEIEVSMDVLLRAVGEDTWGSSRDVPAEVTRLADRIVELGVAVSNLSP